MPSPLLKKLCYATQPNYPLTNSLSILTPYTPPVHPSTHPHHTHIPGPHTHTHTTLSSVHTASVSSAGPASLFFSFSPLFRPHRCTATPGLGFLIPPSIIKGGQDPKLTADIPHPCNHQSMTKTTLSKKSPLHYSIPPFDSHFRITALLFFSNKHKQGGAMTCASGSTSCLPVRPMTGAGFPHPPAPAGVGSPSFKATTLSPPPSRTWLRLLNGVGKKVRVLAFFLETGGDE